MLPFLQPEKISSVIIAKRKASGEIEPSHEEGMEDPALMAACQELIQAVHMKDASGVASAIKSAFETFDKEPHAEGPHLENE